MGAQLSQPVTSKYVQRGGDERYRLASVSMQGFRLDMEDDDKVELSMPKHPEYAFFGVFDGHGGADASKFCHEHLCAFVDGEEGEPGPDNSAAIAFTDETITKRVLAADKTFLEDSTRKGEHGSTAVFAICTHRDQHPDNSLDGEYNLIVCNVGDSRCLIGRKDGSFEALTDDHKPTNEIEHRRIVSAGSRVALGRVNASLALSRAIGDREFKTNKSIPAAEQAVCSVPDIRRTTASAGDYLVICCDGYFEVMDNETLMKFVHAEKEKTTDLREVVCKLTDECLSRGSKDNMTAILIEFAPANDDDKGAEFIPGPLTIDSDYTYVSAFTSNAGRYGYCVSKDLEVKLKTEVPSENQIPEGEEAAVAMATLAAKAKAKAEKEAKEEKKSQTKSTDSTENSADEKQDDAETPKTPEQTNVAEVD